MPLPDLVKVVSVTFTISLPITLSLLSVGQAVLQTLPIQSCVALNMPEKFKVYTALVGVVDPP